MGIEVVVSAPSVSLGIAERQCKATLVFCVLIPSPDCASTYKI